MAYIVEKLSLELIQFASEFHVQKREITNGMVENRDVRISKREQLIGPDKWVIQVDQDFALLKNGEITCEPIPSSRSEEYLDLARYDTLIEAYKHFQKHKGKSVGSIELFSIDDIID